MNNGRQPRTYLGAAQTRSTCSHRLETIRWTTSRLDGIAVRFRL